MPFAFRRNMSFTSVSIHDPNVDAKVFVQQHPHGTGSLASTLDCVQHRFHFYAARLWSLVGQFLDSFDLEWCFFQKERELKTRLYKDYFGKVGFDGEQAPEADTEPSMRALYSVQRHSRRLAHNIHESPQALYRVRQDWLEIAAPENIGAPQSMTTITANQKTSNIRCHVLEGAFAQPDAEHPVAFLRERCGTVPLLQNVCIQVADYIRRRRAFMTYAYRGEYDALRGRMRAVMRRREHQKRGPPHDHVNEIAEDCTMRATQVRLPMDGGCGRCRRRAGAGVHLGVPVLFESGSSLPVTALCRRNALPRS